MPQTSAAKQISCEDFLPTDGNRLLIASAATSMRRRFIGSSQPGSAPSGIRILSGF